MRTPHPAAGVPGHVTVRLPRTTLERLDRLTERTGLSRSHLIRLVLGRLTDRDLPPGLLEQGDALRTARVAR